MLLAKSYGIWTVVFPQGLQCNNLMGLRFTVHTSWFISYIFDWPMNMLGLRLYFAHKRGCKFLIEQPVSSETSLQNRHCSFSLLLKKTVCIALQNVRTVMCPLGSCRWKMRSCGIFDPWDSFCNLLVHGELRFLWGPTEAPVSKWRCFLYHSGTFYTFFLLVHLYPVQLLTFCSAKETERCGINGNHHFSMVNTCVAQHASDDSQGFGALSKTLRDCAVLSQWSRSRRLSKGALVGQESHQAKGLT